MQKVSIIIPVVREDIVHKCVDAIVENVGIPESQYELLIAYDRNLIGCPKMIDKLVQKSKHDLVCFLGDDTIPEKDFLKIALEKMEELPGGWGLVGLNTEGGNDHAHWLADKQLLKHTEDGCFFALEYEHCFCDDELKDIAVELDRWVFAEDAKVKHAHPIFKTAEPDEFHKRAYGNTASRDSKYQRDHVRYCRRKIDRTLDN